eukprot:GILI01017634.1.p1 GENE.GILI01017634.1~~GILI01017634.1.p1  ORF type:complete len:492 (+),score=85.66 GILI01017634.1:32-1477(+)
MSTTAEAPVATRAEQHKHHATSSGPKRNRSVGPVDTEAEETRKGQRKDDLSRTRNAAPPTPPAIASHSASPPALGHDRFISVIGNGGAPIPSSTTMPTSLTSPTVATPTTEAPSSNASDNAKPEVLLIVPRQHPPPLIDLDTQVKRDLRFTSTPLGTDEVEEVGVISSYTGNSAAPPRRTHQPYSTAYSSGYNSTGINNQQLSSGSSSYYGGAYGTGMLYNGCYYPSHGGSYRPPAYTGSGSNSQPGRRTSDALPAPPSYSGCYAPTNYDEGQQAAPSDLGSPTATTTEIMGNASSEDMYFAMAAEIERLQADNLRLREALDISRRSCSELEKLYGRRSGDVIRLQAQLRNSTGGSARTTSPPPLSTLSSEDWSDPTAPPPPPQPLPPPLQTAYPMDSGSITTVVVHPSTQSKRYYCEVCNVLVNSEVSLKAHLEGDKHRKGQYRLQYRRGGAAAGLATSQSQPRSDTTGGGELPPATAEQ